MKLRSAEWGVRSVKAAAIAGFAALGIATAVAQQKAADPNDPRVNLKPGLRDAGVAARGMELVSTRPRPEGFYDPKNPAGLAMPGERPGNATPPAPPPHSTSDRRRPPGIRPARSPTRRTRPRLRAPAAWTSPTPISPSAARTWSWATSTASMPTTSKARRARACSRRSSAPADRATSRFTATSSSCRSNRRAAASTAASQGIGEPISKERFRGVRIFDISDIRNPKQVAAVQTCRGSHTHTLVPKDKQTLYVYGSGTGGVRSGEELADCSAGDPKENPNTALFSIDVIEVPLGAPEKARVVNRPRIFADEKSGNVAGLWAGGDHGPGTQRTSTTNQCHDITVYPAVGLAAGACSGNGILMDISDPANPKRLDAVGGQELRLLAFGVVQQRRHQGDLHG